MELKFEVQFDKKVVDPGLVIGTEVQWWGKKDVVVITSLGLAVLGLVVLSSWTTTLKKGVIYICIAFNYEVCNLSCLFGVSRHSKISFGTRRLSIKPIIYHGPP
jgi:hypothetical protein